MAAGEPDQVALAVLDEHHPLFPAGLTEIAPVIYVEPMRFALDRDSRLAELASEAPDIGDPQVDQRAGRGPIEQQPSLSEPEEREPWWVEPGDQLTAKRVGIEGLRPVQVVGVLCDLMEFQGIPSFIASLRIFDRDAIHNSWRRARPS
jgi:hypothetical protein